MIEILNKQYIDYIFFHLSFFVDLTELHSYFKISENYKEMVSGKLVFFPLSPEKLNNEKILLIDSIPILFPIEKINKPYELVDGCLIFRHDLLKSAFYLLSGYQEYESGKTDKYGRFPFAGSIQEKLGIVEKPVVNYYFEWIINGLNEFCAFHKSCLFRKNLYKKAFLFCRTISIGLPNMISMRPFTNY